MLNQSLKSDTIRVLCFTDNMGSGGAQRQLSYLAILLKRKGYDVTVATYSAGNFFLPTLTEHEIPIIQISAKSKLARIVSFLRITTSIKPNAVIAFQETPSFMAEVSSIFCKSYTLIVSERQTIPIEKLPRMLRFFKFFHRFADSITSNSHTNHDQLISLHPEYKNKVTVIYNTVDLKRFYPKLHAKIVGRVIRLVVLASHKPQKNFAALALALSHLHQEGGLPSFHVDWYGDEAPGCLAVNLALAEKLGLEKILTLYSATEDVPQVLGDSDALIHPALWEGLPNSVCEALASGCPVLMGDVCDARELVTEGVNGFLFDPTSSESIASSIRGFLLLSPERLADMRVQARLRAEQLFDESRFISSYENLLRQVETTR
ncbi:MAG: glycosyltransferase family 4 protein [Candidatus Accumulibacter sp.]|nr:glycosyltransferase family 4 protein [Candidatus Accumulibacter necessarius]